MKISRYSFFWLFLMMACETNVEFEGVEYPLEPVVYANLNADSTVEARIMHSAPVRGEFSSDRTIDDARVVLIENDKDSLLLELSSEGNYKANYIPNRESQYSLWVETSYGNMLSTSIQIPPAPELIMTKLRKYEKEYFDYTDLITAELLFEDHFPQFYRVNVKVANTLQSIRTSFIGEEFISICGGFDGSGNVAIYSIDESCDMKGSFLIERALNRDALPEGTDQLILKVAKATAEFESFESNLIEYNALDLFFEEPLPPYSNFDFGYGYFAAFNEVEVVLNL